jgi:hypothetical protein
MQFDELKKIVKIGFTQKKVYQNAILAIFLQVLLTLTNLLESKIFVGKQNP